jgi:hypothetical protein
MSCPNQKNHLIFSYGKKFEALTLLDGTPLVMVV